MVGWLNTGERETNGRERREISRIGHMGTTYWGFYFSNLEIIPLCF